MGFWRVFSSKERAGGRVNRQIPAQEVFSGRLEYCEVLAGGDLGASSTENRAGSIRASDSLHQDRSREQNKG